MPVTEAVVGRAEALAWDHGFRSYDRATRVRPHLTGIYRPGHRADDPSPSSLGGGAGGWPEGVAGEAPSLKHDETR
jgi:hypothetical protein